MGYEGKNDEVFGEALGVNQYRVRIPGGILWFSYGVLVGAWISGKGLVTYDPGWSVATRNHRGKWARGYEEKWTVLSTEDFWEVIGEMMTTTGDRVPGLTRENWRIAGDPWGGDKEGDSHDSED